MKSVAIAGVLACMIGAAKADELVGTIDDIDTTRNTISVGDKIIAVSPQNTVGPRIGDLRKGDRVKIFYASGRVSSETRFNAIRIEKQGG
ncbi:MAG: hypothetical protein ACREIR_18105 [Geminicoccaceae bacterium]